VCISHCSIVTKEFDRLVGGTYWRAMRGLRSTGPTQGPPSRVFSAFFWAFTAQIFFNDNVLFIFHSSKCDCPLIKTRSIILFHTHEILHNTFRNEKSNYLITIESIGVIFWMLIDMLNVDFLSLIRMYIPPPFIKGCFIAHRNRGGLEGRTPGPPCGPRRHPRHRPWTPPQPLPCSLKPQLRSPLIKEAFNDGVRLVFLAPSLWYFLARYP